MCQWSYFNRSEFGTKAPDSRSWTQETLHQFRPLFSINSCSKQFGQQCGPQHLSGCQCKPAQHHGLQCDKWTLKSMDPSLTRLLPFVWKTDLPSRMNFCPFHVCLHVVSEGKHGIFRFLRLSISNIGVFNVSEEGFFLSYTIFNE